MLKLCKRSTFLLDQSYFLNIFYTNKQLRIIIQKRNRIYSIMIQIFVKFLSINIDCKHIIFNFFKLLLFHKNVNHNIQNIVLSQIQLIMISWINHSLNRVNINKVIAQAQSIKPSTAQNIQGKILELQFQCQGQNGTKQLIVQLMRLYTNAVQHYQQQNDSKFFVFKKRMEHFLKKQNIDEILRGKSGELVSKKDSASKKFEHARTKSKSQVNKLLDKSQKLIQKKRQFVQKVIDQQQKRLKDRIQRRKAMSNRSSNSRDDEQNEESFNNKITPNMFLNDIFQRNSQKKNKKVFI